MHELSKANLLGRLPEGSHEIKGEHIIIPVKSDDEYHCWALWLTAPSYQPLWLSVARFNDHHINRMSALELGHITTLAELIDWYERLSGKKWPEGKGKP